MEWEGCRTWCEGQGYRQKFIHGCGVQRGSFKMVEGWKWCIQKVSLPTGCFSLES